jgi:hypothetical protein
MSDQPDIVLVKNMNYQGEVILGKLSGDRYTMEDGDQYSRERLEQEYEPIFMWSENPNNARWLSLAHVLCSDLGAPAGHIEYRLSYATSSLDTERVRYASSKMESLK